MTEKDPNWCGLKDSPEFPQCCCNCSYHLEVHYHCCTNPKPSDEELKLQSNDGKCVCGVRKGWACVHPDPGMEFHQTRVHDNWPEHSCGCECYDPIDKQKDLEARERAKLERPDFWK